MTQIELENKVRGILAKQLSINESEIRSDSLIGSDLGADSLDTAEIAMMIKDSFNYDLSDQEMMQIKTVKDIFDILEKNLAKKWP